MDRVLILLHRIKSLLIKNKHIFLGVLCFLPTVVNTPVSFFYLIISAIGFLFFFNASKKQFFKYDCYLLAILCVSIIIYAYGFFKGISQVGNSINEYIPYTFFIVTTIFFSRYINSKVLSVIFWLIIVEAIVGVVEFTFQIPYIIRPVNVDKSWFKINDFLYSRRVYGISNSISVFSQKIFIGLLLLFFLKIKRIFFFLVVLILGLIISFNRTVIISVLFFIIIKSIIEFNRFKVTKKKYLILIGVVFSFMFLYKFKDFLLLQFFNGKNQFDFSERDLIFPEYIAFIRDNLLFGNFVNKYWININGRILHAHNSYLQTLASMGGILFAMYVIYLWKIIKKSRLLYLLPILLYSTFQFGIFWGVSLLDIIFFYFIFFDENSPQKSLKVFNKEVAKIDQ